MIFKNGSMLSTLKGASNKAPISLTRQQLSLEDLSLLTDERFKEERQKILKVKDHYLVRFYVRGPWYRESLRGC
jgi:hypothetical protein